MTGARPRPARAGEGETASFIADALQNPINRALPERLPALGKIQAYRVRWPWLRIAAAAD